MRRFANQLQAERAGKTGFSNTWGLAVVCVLSAFVVIAFGVGFLILPATHQQRDQMSMHDNIQHALGHHIHVHDSMSTKNAAATSIPTYVVWDEATDSRSTQRRSATWRIHSHELHGMSWRNGSRKAKMGPRL